MIVKFRDFSLGQKCALYCDQDYDKCLNSCGYNQSDCLRNCGRLFTMCVESCPCHTDCIKGCDGCSNPICSCNVSFFLTSNQFSNISFRISPKMKISKLAKTK